MDNKVLETASEKTTEGVLHGVVAACFTVIAEFCEHHVGIVLIAGIAASTSVFIHFRHKRRHGKRTSRIVHHKF